MNVKRDLFLQALKAALKNEKVAWDMEISPQEWRELFSVASAHRVLPMIFEATYSCPAAASMESEMRKEYKQQTIRLVMLQTIKTSEFLRLLQYLQEAGVQPLVVKGIVCRSLYRNPDYRLSGDEDLLISPEQLEQCHQALQDYGMCLLDTSQDIYSAYEMAYGKPGNPVYIELHKSLFPPESAAYGHLNAFFEDVQSRKISIKIGENSVMTMGYTDHLLYLICHAFKHFLHSGFGIRQVCDIVLFANAYGKEIDWNQIVSRCREIHAELFCVALFKIGEKYLDFLPEEACYPQEWQKMQVDEKLLLDDLLDAGIYGDGTMSRKHSSNITLNAVSAQKKGKKAGPLLLSTLFLPRESMEKQYPFLRKHPYLLPVAWVKRIMKYRKERGKYQDNDVANAVAIGSRRIELFKQYKILD